MKPTIETILDNIKQEPIGVQEHYTLWYKSIYEEQLLPINYLNIIIIDDGFMEVEEIRKNGRDIKYIPIETLILIMKKEKMVWNRKIK